MHIVVLVLGLIALAAGLVALGLGFAIKEFSLGGTVLIIGTIMTAGGLIMIAVSAVVRELRRIVQAINRSMPAPPRPGELIEPYAPGAFRPGIRAPRVPPVAPPAPSGDFGQPTRDTRPREPEPAAPPFEQTAAATPAGPVPELTEPAAPSLQPTGHGAAEAEPSHVPPPKPEGAPLAPEDSSREPAFDMPDERQEPLVDLASESPATDGREIIGGTSEEEPVFAEPPRRRRPAPFDAIWPPLRVQEPAGRMEGDGDDTAPPRDSEATGRGDESLAAQDDISPQPEPAEPEPQVAEASEAKVDTPFAVSILKSGVVDDMAYTLYSDGSIEAELPTGTIRFASIHELRMHLERTE
jgi:hypothetical protein